ncbi:hypothetical protein KBB27_03735 [Patescibacteria group bacterium]|nr:hypothetical protein [Patescibacteria group bacterium]
MDSRMDFLKLLVSLVALVLLAWLSSRRKPAYYSLTELIGLIDQPFQSACRDIFAEYDYLFHRVPGSRSNHQAWPGGYSDHVREVMNIAKVLFQILNLLRPLPFSLSDALLILFLHDFEKLWKYEIGKDGEILLREGMGSKAEARAFRERKIEEHGIVLTEEQRNALTYAEGELGDYSPDRRVMGPLAAFVHVCDVLSARLWHDHPLERSDPWGGAGRFR